MNFFRGGELWPLEKVEVTKACIACGQEFTRVVAKEVAFRLRLCRHCREHGGENDYPEFPRFNFAEHIT